MKNTKTKVLKEKIIGRKGMAMELAIIVLLVVFAMCSLVVSIAVVQTKNAMRKQNALSERLILDNIGEQFCAAVAKGQTELWLTDDSYSGDVEQNGNVYTLNLCDIETGNVVLIVSLEKNDADSSYKVTKWNYQ